MVRIESSAVRPSPPHLCHEHDWDHTHDHQEPGGPGGVEAKDLGPGVAEQCTDLGGTRKGQGRTALGVSAKPQGAMLWGPVATLLY